MPSPSASTLCLTAALAALPAPARADDGGWPIGCAADAAVYCTALAAELAARDLPPPAPGTRIELLLTGRSPARISARLRLLRPGRPPETSAEAVAMLLDGAPESLAPKILATALAEAALPMLTR